MKTYVTHNEIRFIGKGWEIRHQLRLLVSTARGPETTLQEALTTFRGLPSGAKHSKHIVPQRRRPEKNAGPHLVPFPSL